MKCPKCDAGLNRLTITTPPKYGGEVLQNERTEGKIEVEQCLSCNGLWFDANELDEYLNEKLLLINSPKVAETKQYDKKSGPCPKCQKMMEEDVLKNVVIDRCPACQGVWLDGGELDKLEGKYFSISERWKLFFDGLKEPRQGD
jgi:Zn-finger nucleic acid-binding protein